MPIFAMVSDLPVTRTRITIPRRRTDLLSRPRLLNLMNELIEKKLILVTAPAGYGKTSLLIDFTCQASLPVCWYTVNTLDNEPQRFITNLISALAIKFPTFGQRTSSALKSTKGTLDLDYIVNVLLGDLDEHVTEHFILILDDYYLINDSAQIRHFITRFIQDVDENCHLVLTSRMLLPLPVIAVLAGRSEVSGLSFEDLAFQEDEVRQLYRQNYNRALDEQEVGEILRTTEGWITGIILNTQLKLERSRGRAGLAHALGIGVDDYFLQLISQQPQEIYEALLRTSLLEEFNPETCEQVIGQALGLQDLNWAGLLDRIQSENLFVLPVGDDGSWLRYHRLFLDFLRNQMRRERPEETQRIEQRLAEYSLEQAEWDQAFAITQKLNQPEQLVRVIEQATSDMLTNGRIPTLSAWLDTLPVEILTTHPSMISLQGFIASITGDISLALTLFDQALNAMALPQDRQTMARALVWRAGTYRISGNLAAAMADAHEVIRLVENDPAARKLKAEAMRCIGLCLDKQGRSAEALDWLSQALSIVQAIKDSENAAIIQLGLGVIHENLGHYSISMSMYQAALEHFQRTENSIWLSNLLNNLGVLQHLTGDYKAAIISYEQALQHAYQSNYSRIEAFILTGIGDIYVELNALDEAFQAYQQASIIAQRLYIHSLYVYLLVQQAIIAGAKGEYAEGYRLIELARSVANKENLTMEANLCALEYGGLKIKEGQPAEAIDLMEKACEFFEAGGHKVQRDKACLYLALAYGQLNKHEMLVKNLLKVLACLNEEYRPALLIATANRYYDETSRLLKLDYVESQLKTLFASIADFWNELPELRRFIRQHALAVPFAPPVLHIRALGKMQVRVNKRQLTLSDFQTQAARDLFFMLLAHPAGITRSEIAAYFWPDADEKDLKFRLKNTIYRLRHAVGSNTILLDQETYRFNNTIDYEYDVELFLRENAEGLKAKDPLRKLSHFREAIKLYKGTFLPELAESWVHTERESLQQIFLNILVQTAEIYLELGNFSLALEYCQRALKVDNCLEVAYRLSFRIYAAMGDRVAMVRQYSLCCEVLQREIHTDPSPQTQTLYQELLK
jgi:ATP/maltotriose-dependent transcriptional regulator MalT/DNA-binding SARP family transcriptional activator